MASNRVRDHLNQVCGSCNSSGKKFHGFSKAQSSLSKILNIISCFREEKSSEVRLDSVCCGNRGFGIDLNLRLGVLPEIDDDDDNSEIVVAEGRLSECSVVREVVDCDSPEIVDGFSTVEKSCEGECEITKEDYFASSTIGENQTSVNTNVQSQILSFDDTNNNGGVVSEEIETKHEQEHERERRNDLNNSRDEGFLGLLIDAARLISGEFESEPAKPSDERTETKGVVEKRRRVRSKRETSEWGEEWNGGREYVSPVVRTKRGRSQVLPCRYRDSVIEPWKRLENKSSPKRKKVGR